MPRRAGTWPIRRNGHRCLAATALADVIIAFFTAAGEIAGDLDGLARRIYPAGALWIAWPRRAVGHRSAITDTVIRERALPMGLVDVKVAAIDEDWSGLRLVWRVANRGKPSPALCGRVMRAARRYARTTGPARRLVVVLAGGIIFILSLLAVAAWLC